MIARRPCTPPLPLEAFNEKLALQLVPVRRKKKKKRNNDDTKIVKSRSYKRFLAWRIEGRYKHVGLMYS